MPLWSWPEPGRQGEGETGTQAVAGALFGRDEAVFCVALKFEP